jgi:CTP synthase
MERMEIIELKDHPFFVAVQYHPEYLSRPMRPSPPYLGLVLAATGKLQPFLSKSSHKSHNEDSEDEEMEKLVRLSKPRVSLNPIDILHFGWRAVDI